MDDIDTLAALLLAQDCLGTGQSEESVRVFWEPQRDDVKDGYRKRATEVIGVLHREGWL